MAKSKMQYYDIQKPPLLMQGFPRQVTQAPVLLESNELFQTEIDRGIVVYVDYVVINENQILNGLLESSWNSTQIDLMAGGQDLLRGAPAERYNYAFDIGDRKEQKIPVNINAGQTLRSRVFLPDTTSSQNSQNLVAQLILYYTTKSHDEWIKKYARFNNGLGLKRDSFRIEIPTGAGQEGVTLRETLPKNQGNIIGFSILAYGEELHRIETDFALNDLAVVKDVLAMRFSRFSQRDPNIQWIAMAPGSVFKLFVRPDAGLMTTDNWFYVTIYYDN